MGIPANKAAESESEPKAIEPGLWPAMKSAASDWSEHKSAKAGAAIAYYSIFSIGPLIVVVTSIAALIFGREGVQREVTDAIRGLLGEQGAQSVNTMLTAAGKPSEGVFASIIGTAALIFAAIGVVVQLKEALNVVWEVKPKLGGGIWGFARNYVLSLAGVLTVGFLLLVSMLLTAALAAFTGSFGSAIPEALMQATGVVVSFAIISLLFAMMFKWLPDAKVEWRDVWLGGIATAALFEIGKFLIGFYIGKQGLEFDLRGVSLDRGGVDLGLLHGSDRPVRCGVHPCPLETARLEAPENGERGCQRRLARRGAWPQQIEDALTSLIQLVNFVSGDWPGPIIAAGRRSRKHLR